MRGFCAKCGRVYDGRMLCPQCGIELVEEIGALSVPLPPEVLEASSDGPSFIRRLALGAITLLGLYNGLKHLALAALLSYNSGGTLPPGALTCLLVAATLAASVAAGTVNRRAELTGLLLAVGASIGFLAPQFLGIGHQAEEWLVGIPTLLAIGGVAGGTAGRLMIPPAPALPRFAVVETPARPVKRRHVRLTWWRIVVGTILVVVGTNAAEAIRYWLFIFLGGNGAGLSAGPLVTWQISILAALVGGGMAGANTRVGFRQGSVAGLLASAATLVAVASAGSEQSLVLQFWLNQLDLNQPGPMAYAALAGSVFVATMVGGCLGEQLVPPRRK